MRLTIKFKLIATFGIILAVVAGAMTFSWHQLKTSKEYFSNVVDRDAQQLVLVTGAQANVLRAQRDVSEIMTLNNQRRIDELMQRVDRNKNESLERLSALRELYQNPVDRRQIDTLLDAMQSLYTTAGRTVSNVGQAEATLGQQDEGQELLHTAGQDAWTKLHDEIDAERVKIVDQIGVLRANALADYENVRGMLIVATVAAISITVVAGFWLVQSISRSINAATRLAHAVASGDLNAHADAMSDDELGDLVNTLNATVARLRIIVSDARDVTGGVVAGSHQLSVTSEQLSQATKAQGASILQVLPLMENTSSTHKQSIDNASQAEETVRHCVHDASARKDAVSEAIKSAEALATKIHVLQDTARQADLLALNAAVGAARAGEPGRGFAPLATKLRKLAERSQISAAEISALSASTVEAAQRAGEILSMLEPAIQRTAGLVEEISASNRKQTLGAARVTNSIQALYKVSQQNRGASDEIASTAKDLFERATQLQKVIAFFQLDGDHGLPLVANDAVPTRSAPAPVVMSERRRCVSPVQDGGADPRLDDTEENVEDAPTRRASKAA